MEAPSFIDYYEVLEISPNANSETVERMFRYLARHYHPDNLATADRDRFDLILEAHNVLRDPAKRVRYDLDYRKHVGARTELAEEASDGAGVDHDQNVQGKLLAILYAKRRRDSHDPGIGNAELQHLLACPMEILEFNLWYMREKKWVRTNQNGTLEITVEGVDRIQAETSTHSAARKLLTDQS
jgi:curved DNA-binding protein CbpA